LVTFVTLAVPRLRHLDWTGVLPVGAVLIAATHLLVERYRWQMVPAYAVTAVLVLVWLVQRAGPVRPVSGMVVAGAVALGVIGLVLSTALPVVVPSFRFPEPSGPHRIGTLTYHWHDETRAEVLTSAPGDHREVMVQVWYPASPDPEAPRAPYMREQGALANWLAWLLRLRIPQWLSRPLDSVITNAVAAAPLAATDPTYPVLLFMQGLSGFRQMNTFQVEELVSHGYVVAAIDQPYAAAAMSFPDGRQVLGLGKRVMWPLIQQSLEPSTPPPELNGRPLPEGIIPYLARDAVFVLDRLADLNEADPNGVLTGALDLSRAGVFGVSLGGITAPEACHLDPRFRACMAMEAPIPAEVVTAGLEQPTLLLIGDVETMRAAGWAEEGITQHHTNMRSLYENLGGSGYYVVTNGMYHLNLTDAPLLLRAPFTALGLLGPIDVERAHGIVNAYTVAFFDKHLRGLPAPPLDAGTRPYREIDVEARPESRGWGPD